MIPKHTQGNKNVSIATKICVLLIIFILSLVLFAGLLANLPVPNKQIVANAFVNYIPKLERYYIKDLVGRFGLSTNDDQESDEEYESLDALFDDLLCQHQQNVVVEFVGDFVLDEEVKIDNSNNRLSANDIDLTIIGKAKSTVKGSTFYNPNRANTYAMHIINIDKMTLSNFTLETETMAINVLGETNLIIESSSIVTKYDILNKNSGGIIVNSSYGSKVDIISSTVKGLKESEYELYAIYSYGDVTIDKGVVSEPFSLLECYGGISMAAGTLSVYGGEVKKTGPSSDYFALKLFNSDAVLNGGHMSNAAALHSPNESSILVKQSNLEVENGSKVDTGVFIAANDTNDPSSLTVDGTKIIVPAGAFNIVMSCEDTMEFGVNDDNVSLAITDVKEDKVDTTAWGEGAGNVIKLSDIEQFASEGIVQPKATIYRFITYKHLSEDGTLVTDPAIKVENGTLHTVKNYNQLYKTNIFSQKCWEDSNGGKHLKGSTITVENDYEFMAIMQLKTPSIELGYTVIDSANYSIKLLVTIPADYQGDNIGIEYSWYKIAQNGGAEIYIQDTEMPFIELIAESTNCRYKVVVKIKVLDLSVGGETEYSIETFEYVDVVLEQTNVIPEVDPENPDLSDPASDKPNEPENKPNLALILGTTIPSAVIVISGVVAVIILHKKSILAKVLAKKPKKKEKDKAKKEAIDDTKIEAKEGNKKE